jgi:4a-hydroxytetrahydrobiopterin dehydratase
MRALLDDLAIERWRSEHDGWKRKGDLLEKAFTFASFVDAVEFVNRVAELAEAADHHPDMDIRYDTVRVGLATHSAGGITAMDTSLAEEIDRTA